MGTINIKTFILSLIEQGISLETAEDKLRIKGDLRQLSDETKGQIKQHKEAIVSYINDRKRTANSIIVKRDPNAVIPLSFSQQRLWFMDKLEPDSGKFNIPMVLQLNGEVDTDALHKALHALVERHEVLRTVYSTSEEGTAEQIVLANAELAMDVQSLEQVASEQFKSESFASEQRAQLADIAQQEALKPFDLAQGSVLRVKLIRLSSLKHVMLITLHHICSDGWSLGVFTRDFVALYRAFSENTPNPLPPLPVQYGDYALWQRSWLQGDFLAQQLGYWRDKLADLPQTHSLPLDRSRPAIPTLDCGRVKHCISQAQTEQLLRLSNRYNCSLFAVLQAIFATLISRYSNSTDIVFGSPVANRTQANLSSLIGFFVNTMVFRNDLSGNPTFTELLQRTKNTVLDGLEHQHIPFDMLVEQLQPERTAQYHPLFQIQIALQNNAGSAADISGLDIEQLSLTKPVAKFDLSLELVETEKGIETSWNFSEDIFEQSSIENLAASFEVLIAEVLSNPEQPVHHIPLLSHLQRHRLLNEFAPEPTSDSPLCTIHQLFEQQADAQQDKVAVAFEGATLSYRQLNASANRLAGFLQQQGVSTDTIVAICMERSLSLMTAILAVLKAGGSYVPIDPNLPQERIAYIVDDSGCTAVLTDEELATAHPFGDVPVMSVDQLQRTGALTQFSDENLPVDAGKRNGSAMAYVIYTSGSTGQPKGVVLEHAGLTNLATAQIKAFGVTAQSRVLQFASISFDASVSEWAMALSAGAQLHLISDVARKTPNALGSLVEQQQITHATLPPVLLPQLNPEQFSSLTHLIVAGEACSLEVAQQWAVNRHFYNAYGPSETTVCASIGPYQPGNQTLHIGKPLDNVQIFLLDKHDQLSPLGAIGELCVSGICLAREYLNNPSLTEDKFIVRNIDGQGDKRLYKTGDLARWLPDGNLEFIGRADDQVKLRGFRIELGEIAALLREHESVEDALVLVKASDNGDKRLAAYAVVPELERVEDQWQLVSQLRGSLKDRLPSYMIPAEFSLLLAWPLSQTGKINKSALPEATHNISESEFTEPESPLEAQLVKIWCHTLETETVSTHANFFDIGGHSLLAVRLVSDINNAFSVKLDVADVFKHNTIQEQARLIETSTTAVQQSIATVSRELPLALSYAQQRLWFIDQLEPGGYQYNMPMAFQLVGELNQAALQFALDTIVQRHEILRTVYSVNHAGEACQHIQDVSRVTISHSDFRHLPISEGHKQAQQVLQKDALTPFDLTQDVMLRVHLCALADSHFLLYFNTHHIASDGWSLEVMSKEFFTLYNARCQQQNNPLPPLPIQYADFAQWQRATMAGEGFESLKRYWKTQLAQCNTLLNLPLRDTRPTIQHFDGATIDVPVSQAVSEQIKQLAIANDASLFMVLHAAFAIVLSRYSYSNDLVTGTPTANREHSDVFDLIGFFVNSLPLRSRCLAQNSFIRHLQDSRDVVLDAFAHQQLPFDIIVDELEIKPSTSYSPLFQVMFSVQQHQAAKGLALDNLEIEAISPEQSVAKFDLTLNIAETETGLITQWQYSRGLFERATIEQMASHYQQLLATICQDPSVPLQHLLMHTKEELMLAESGWNTTELWLPEDHKAFAGSSGKRYLLTQDLTYAPVGATGELYIPISDLPISDLQETDADAAALANTTAINHPLCDEKLMATGLLYCWKPSEGFIYLGETNTQVKHHGLAFNLHQVSQCLLAHPEVRDCNVVIHPETALLTAYVDLHQAQVASDAVDTSAVDTRSVDIVALDTWLSTRLEEAKRPQAYKIVANLNEEAPVGGDPLRYPEAIPVALLHDAAPVSETEKTLSEVWLGILDVESVGRYDSFFNLGGNSLSAVRLEFAIQSAFDVQISIKDLFTHDTLASQALLIEQQESAPALSSTPPPILPVKRNTNPLSFAQQRLWFIDQLTGSSHYNVQNILLLKGELSLAALEQALYGVIDRHQVLRSVFVSEKGVASQRVLATPKQVLKRTELQSLNDEPAPLGLTSKQQIRELAQADVTAPFDLSKDLLIRSHLVKIDEQHHALIITAHHIAVDGWSLGIFTQELSALYSAFLQQTPNPLPPLPIQYGDFAHWQRQRLDDKQQDDPLLFWRDYLKDAPQTHSLPLDYARPEKQRFEGTEFRLSLDSQTSQQLNGLCQSEDATLYMVLQTAFSVLLSRYGNADDILFGTPIAGRSQPEVAALIGFFVNTLVFRCQIDGNQTFTEYLKENKQRILNVYAKQDVPFELLVDELSLERSTSHSALYQIVFAVQNFDAGEITLPGLTLMEFEKEEHRVTPDYELGLFVFEREHHLDFIFSCNTAVFNLETLKNLAAGLESLLQSIVQNPQQKVSQLATLNVSQRQQLQTWNDTACAFTETALVQTLVEQWAHTTPAHIAIAYSDAQMRYDELNRHANRIANFIREQSISEGEFVGLCIEQSASMIAGMLGILKAGCAYVPLDPDLPEARMEYILEDAGIELVLTQSDLLADMPFEDLKTLPLDLVIEHNTLKHLSEQNPQNVAITPEQPAYLIYTSGTTGQPKGVVVSHYNVVGLVTGHEKEISYIDVNPKDVIAQAATIAFDAATFEIWAALCNGARVQGIDKSVLLEPAKLATTLRDNNVSIMFITTALFNQVANTQPDCFGTLRALLFGGELVNYTAVQTIIEQGKPSQLLHVYGPTETTTFATCSELDGDYLNTHSSKTHSPNSNRVISIGGPLANTQLFVLGRDNTLLMPGAVGELFIGGCGLATGYLNQPALTDEKFVSCPHIGAERLYRTGDLVRWLPTGELEFIGRADHQVKIRGFRIELGEIELQLKDFSAVDDALISVFDDPNGSGKRLVAYVVSNLSDDKNAQISRFKQYLENKLPEHMVPSTFILLDAMPTNANGKVDRKALPAPESIDVEQAAYTLPTNETETILCALIGEVLGIERVGIDDNFFSLGGDSILSIRLVAEAKLKGINLSVKDIFSCQTVEQLAVRADENPAIEAQEQVEHFALLTEQDKQELGEGFEQLYDDVYPMTELQLGMIYHTRLAQSGVPYHDIMTFHLKTQWHQECFEQALQFMFDSHVVLRTGYQLDGARPLQMVYKQYDLPLFIEDISTEPDQDGYLQQWLEEEKRTPFAWQGPLFKVFIFKRGNSSFEFALSFHHAVYDGWSNSNFISKLLLQYQELIRGNDLPPSEPEYTFRDYVAAEHKCLADPKAKAFWSEMLEGAPLKQLPVCASANEEALQLELAEHLVHLDDALSSRLIARAKELGISMQSLLVAAHIKVLSFVSGSKSALTSFVINGRPEYEGGDKGIGLFLNALPVCFKLEDGSWEDLIRATASNLTAIMQYRHYPTSAIQRDTGLSFSEVAFNYTHFHAYKELTENLDAELLGGIGVEQANYQFAVNVSRTVGADHLKLILSYDSHRYDAPLAERMSGYYLKAFEAVVGDIQQSHHRFSPLSEVEQQSLLSNFQAKAAEFPRNSTIHQLIEQQANTFGANTALVFDNQAITYQALNERANQLAHFLLSRGVCKGEVVGLCLNRSPDLIVAALGVLKAGAAYVPIDPTYPESRITHIVDDAKLKVMLSHQALVEAGVLGATPTATLLSLDDVAIQKTVAAMPDTRPVVTQHATDLAYVIYTSGSTGLPKGVMVEHRGLCNLVQAHINLFSLNEHSKVLQFASFSFDGAAGEWMVALCAGAQLHLITQATQKDAMALGQYTRKHQLTYAALPPILLPQLNEEDFDSVKHLMVVGDVCSDKLAMQWSRNRNFFNGYGPSEASVCTSVSKFDRKIGMLNIGKPLDNVQTFVLDTQQQLAPVGTVGELYIGGVGLARGYLGKEALTAEKFTLITLADGVERRLYRTGDLARWNADGCLEFVGRNDSMVKIRGYRVELGEIENVLLAHDLVKDCSVQVDDSGDAIAAYIATDATDNQANLKETLRQYLKSRLPFFMVPGYTVLLAQLPINSNGKLDKEKLPDLLSESQEEGAYVAPGNETEALLCQIWQDLLRVGQVGVNDNFFLLGGHSLLAMQLLSKIREQFNIEIELYELLPAETVAKQSEIISSYTSGKGFKSLQQLKAGQTHAMPIYMIPGLGGHSQIFAQLSHHLNTDNPLYALNPLGLDGKSEPHSSLYAAADYYAKEIMAHQSTGSCMMLGFSQGAPVAFEVAKKLKNQGLEVPLVVILDGHASYEALPNQVLEQTLDNSAQAPDKPVSGNGFERVFKAHSQWSYQPDNETVRRIVVISSQSSASQSSFSQISASQEKQSAIKESTLEEQWQPYSSMTIDSYVSDANHDTILGSPAIEKVTSVMKTWIAQVESEEQAPV